MTTTITPRTATHIIYHGDDIEQIADLRIAADTATRQEKGNAARLGDLGDAQASWDAYHAFVDEAAERAVQIRVNQIGRKAFRALLTEHPPRDGNDSDKAEGFNDDTFPEALLLASMVEPEFPSNAARQEFLDSLADGDFDALFMKAYLINRSPGTDPKKAGRYSETTLTSDEIYG
jgi:hypothetical protein